MDHTINPTAPEPAVESPIHIPITKLLPSNGLLKRHAPPSSDQYSTVYKECLKNHAARLGSHALDGCREFMPCSENNNNTLKCAACGCHRNFHRRLISPVASPLLQLEYHSHHRHRPPSPPPRRGSSSPASNTSSPPPLSSSYHHVIYPNLNPRPTATRTSRKMTITTKRFRTRFTQAQKEDMLELAERVAWRMVKKDDELVSEVCGRIGVDKGVFRVWMHNNKKPRRRSNYNFVSTTSIPARTYNAAAGISGANGGFSRNHNERTALDDDVKEEEQEEKENLRRHDDDDYEDNGGDDDSTSSSANIVPPAGGTNYGSSCSS